ncbi:YjgN family protein [Glaciecola sp. 1036]|uniref:YjgN family protein n=1 Tax=Alteromonadaceae TaxID=72275 RepID=UPI003D006C7D
MNKEESPNFEQYTLEELHQALLEIDHQAYPERVEKIQQCIAAKSAPVEISQEQQLHTPEPKQYRKCQVNFLGNGKEYFSIWIVNLLLTIVTLGIYSAWATVRNNRYFYSNTEIDGHRFSYLAQPKQILIGRIIGVLLFAIFYAASVISPFAAVITSILIFCFVPVLVCMAMRFRMRMTAYRNVRFNFTKNYGRAYVVFLLYPILALFTFYLAYPWALKKIDEFLYSHITYGNKQMKPNLQTAEYYVASIVAGIAGMIIAFIGGFLMIGTVTLASESSSSGNTEVLVMIVTFLLYAFVFVVSGSIYQAFIRNHVYNSTQLEDVANFNSDVKIGSLIMLRLTNLLMLICTLGFAMPWVKVRTLTFFANATQVNIEEGAESVISDDSQSDSAIADEVSNIFDVDIAIG